MDHADIDAADLVARYLRHRLSPEEEQAFEAHFVDCPTCLDRLDEARALGEGLKVVAMDAAAHAGAPATASATVVAGWPRLALAASILLALGLAASLAWIAGLRGELQGLRQDQARLDARNRDLERQVQQIAIAPAPPAAPTTAPNTAPLAAAGVPVVALSMVRGVAIAESAPAVQIARPSASPFVVLLLDLGTASAPAYRVVITDAHGQPIWTGDRLAPTTPAELAIAVPSTLLAAGDYVVRVEDRAHPVGHFAFRVR